MCSWLMHDHAVQDVCEKLLPLMSKPGRIVNVCSVAGKQSILRKPELLQEFQVLLSGCMGQRTIARSSCNMQMHSHLISWHSSSIASPCALQHRLGQLIPGETPAYSQIILKPKAVCSSIGLHGYDAEYCAGSEEQ